MATALYEIALRAASELTDEERTRLAREIIEPRAQPARKRRSILELEGLGKELWEDADPLAHVRAERDSWDR
jgi:hypothetical protein